MENSPTLPFSSQLPWLSESCYLALQVEVVIRWQEGRVCT